MDITISAAARLADGNVLPSPADVLSTPGSAASATSAAEFGRVLATATSAALTTAPSAAPSWLTGPDEAQAAKPHISDFMKRTGVDFFTASELLYGVVGSNVERRDWATIMSKEDPVIAARQATRALYGDTSQPTRTDGRYLEEDGTLARQGNFALTEERTPKGGASVQDVKLIDAQGLLLRSAGQDAATMARNVWLFGFDLADAQALIPSAQALSPRLATELKAAVGLPFEPVQQFTAPAEPVALSPAAPSPVPTASADTAPTLTPEALMSKVPSLSVPAFSTADVMRWREVAAEAGNALAANTVGELLALQ